MRTIDQIKQLSKDEIIDRIASFDLLECGIYSNKISERWKSLLQQKPKAPSPLVISLNNNDVHKVLLHYLKQEPHKVLEGMLIAAYVLSAEELYLFLPEQEKELGARIEADAKALGIKIIYNDFVDLRQYEEGIFHHIGTMATLAEIFAGNYEPKALVSVLNAGVLSEPRFITYGTKLSELIPTKREEIKAIEIGTRLYDASALEIAIDAQLPLGNGVILVHGKGSCMIHEAEKRLETARKLTCGKCTFCREGILQIHEMTKDISKGKGNSEYLSLMTEIGEAIPDGSLCSIGQTGAAFLLESLKHYPEEYEDHVKRKKCTAGVCTAFTSIYIDPELCTGCEECLDVCPVDCIEGKAGFIHMIDTMECTKCGKCMEACSEAAIKQAVGRTPKLPDRLTKCGKFKKHS